METTKQILELKDCYKFLKDELSQSDIELISKITKCNISTILNYLKGEFPDTSLFRIVSPKIVAIGFDILNKKPNELFERINEITNGKELPTL